LLNTRPSSGWLGAAAFHFWSGTASVNNSYAPLVSQGPSRQINLDLSSTNQSATGGNLLGQQTIDINVGASQFAVNSGTALTPAEKAAVMQVLHTGRQSLLLDSMGSADGGTLVIGTRFGQSLSGLVIPKGVTVIDTSRSGNLNINGDVTDAGSLFVTTKNPLLSAVSLSANNITVQAGGLISTSIPAGILTNMPASNLNLNLTALNNITNAGTISTSGALSLTAGGSINNSSAHAKLAALQAVGNVNLIAGSGAITNNGEITSSAGDINMSATALANNLNISAAGGVFNALNGAINVKGCANCAGVNINLVGGTYISQQLNLNSGNGNLNVNIEQATGIVNSSGNNVSLQVDTGKMTLGTMAATGDPTVVDFSAAGIDLSGTPSVHGDPYIIVSGGSISSSVSGLSIDTSANDSTTDNIVLIAGATGPAWAGGGNPVIITGPSSSGGNVDLSNVSTLSSAGTSGTLPGFGGNITLVAFAPNGRSSVVGKVILPYTLTIDAGGSDGSSQLGTNGNVTIIAGVRSGLSKVGITVGGINASGATGGGGAVAITSATPVIGNGVQINPLTGNITGTFLGNAPLYTAVALSGIITAATSVTVAVGGNITAGDNQSISSPTTVLWSQRGGVGTSTASIILNSTTNLSATAASSVYINDQASAADVTLTTGTATDGSTIGNSAGGIYNLMSLGKVALLSNVSAGQKINVSSKGSIISTENVTAQITAGQLPTASVINAAGTLLYVADAGLNQLLVINTKTNLVVATRPVGTTPSSVALSPNGLIVYVSNAGSNTISSFDTATLTARAPISVPTPTVMAFNTDGSTLYVASSTTNVISEVNTKTNMVVGTINLSGGPQSVSFDEANGFVYVAVSSPNEIFGINPATGAQVTISLPHAPTSIGQCPCGTKLFVSSASSNSVYIVSLVTNNLAATINLPSGSMPTGVAINPTGSMAYVTDSGTNSVSVITTDLSITTSATSLPVATNVSGNYAGFLGVNAVAYVPGVQSGNGIVSVLTTPALVAPVIALNSQDSNIRVGTGAASVNLEAFGYAIVTGSGNLQSTGGTVNGELQYATRNNLTIAGPQSALTIDFHALNGTFTNNSTIGATGAALFVASPMMFNNGTIENFDATGSVTLQSPSGVLQIAMGRSSQINVGGASGTITLDPALGFSVNVSGGAGKGGFNANTINIDGNLGQTVNINVMQMSGTVSTTSGASSVTVITAGSSFVVGNIDTSSASGPGGSIFIQDNGPLTVSGDVGASGTSGGRIDLYSSNIIIDEDAEVKANGTNGSGGKIQFAPLYAPVLLISNSGVVSATNAGANSGIVGFNGGNGRTLAVNGSDDAIITAGQFVNFGNLNSKTLMIKSIFTVVGTFTPIAPFTGSYSLGAIRIVGNSISGTMQVSGASKK
jgi:YVTN family beta-propeller protein